MKEPMTRAHSAWGTSATVKGYVDCRAGTCFTLNVGACSPCHSGQTGKGFSTAPTAVGREASLQSG
eukprot:11213725-Lingulodinium_polyedra.AAC.1